MKTVFDQSVVHELSGRIGKLNGDAQRKWGKMNVYEMLKHCVVTEHMFLGDKQYKQLFVGKLFGKIALKGVLKNDLPLKKNQPTHPEFQIKGTGDIKPLQESWITLLERYPGAEDHTFSGFIHPFFGRMSKSQIGEYAYKHVDHHLRQFGV